MAILNDNHPELTEINLTLLVPARPEARHEGQRVNHQIPARIIPSLVFDPSNNERLTRAYSVRVGCQLVYPSNGHTRVDCTSYKRGRSPYFASPLEAADAARWSLRHSGVPAGPSKTWATHIASL